MADSELLAKGMEVLTDLIAVLMEDAHEAAVSTVPDQQDQRLQRIAMLRQAGLDIVRLADACEVLIRRAG